MLRSLKEVQADDSVIGFYQATTLGAFLTQTLVDTQAIHQDKLRHGGIVIVHGEHIPRALVSSLTYIYMCLERRITNNTRQCVIPGISINSLFFGCIQKIELQHHKVS